MYLRLLWETSSEKNKGGKLKELSREYTWNAEGIREVGEDKIMETTRK